MQRTKDVRGSMDGNKKWGDLLRYHDTNEDIRNPSNHSIMNVINTFVSYDNASFPCTDEDTEHGGLGSHCSILERSTAFHHALRYEQIPDITSDALANCNCGSHTTNRFVTCPLQTASFQPNIWPDIARSLPHFSHGCWTPTDPAEWTPDHPQATHCKTI